MRSCGLEHAELRGPARLISVVAELQQSCPWTATLDGHTMVTWLRSELHEVETAMEVARCAMREASGAQESSRRELVAEVGDVLFDALMLQAVMAREFSFDPSEAWTSAAAKVERRTPYVELWGDGSVARTALEATDLWKREKLRETSDVVRSDADEASDGMSASSQRATVVGSRDRDLFFVFVAGMIVGGALVLRRSDR